MLDVHDLLPVAGHGARVTSIIQSSSIMMHHTSSFSLGWVEIIMMIDDMRVSLSNASVSHRSLEMTERHESLIV
jgi:hypothetical protein